MDSRHKIHPAAAVAQTVTKSRRRGAICRLLIGYFDPLLASHARKLHQFRQGADLLVVLVDSPEHPLLPPQARAELVASLEAVEYVVLKEADFDTLLRAFDSNEVLLETNTHEQSTQALMRRAHERQHA